MKGLGLKGSVLAVIVLVAGDAEDRPGGWAELTGTGQGGYWSVRRSGKSLRARRAGVVLGLHTWHNTDHESMSSIIETHSTMWARRFPADIVMVVEVLP